MVCTLGAGGGGTGKAFLEGFYHFSLLVGRQVGLRVSDKPLPTLPSCGLSSLGSEIQVSDQQFHRRPRTSLPTTTI